MFLWPQKRNEKNKIYPCIRSGSFVHVTALASPQFFSLSRYLMKYRIILLALFSTLASLADSIPVSSFSFNLHGGADKVLQADDLRQLEVRFQRDDEGALTKFESDATKNSGSVNQLSRSLGNLSEVVLTINGVSSLQEQIAQYVTELGYAGVVVMADPNQIDSRTGEDLREENSDLTIDIWLTEVSDLRTVGKGHRIKEEDPLNNPMHERIRKNSPIQVAAAEAKEEESNASGLIEKRKLETYLERLNRHPVRSVEGALSSGSKPGEVILDYIVSEAKPWVAYAQVSNTGSESTGEWRERVGGAHHQLTGNDDSLSFDFITAELDRANAFIGSYEIPLVHPDYLKARVFGSYSDFEAQNLVIDEADDFTGDTLIYGGELTYTPFYLWRHALGVTAGVQIEEIAVENILGATEGSADLTTGYVRLSAEKNKQHHRSRFSIGYEENFNSNETLALTSLGRLNTGDDYGLLTFDFHQSFFLEPLFGSYHKPDEEKWWTNALVHELSFSVRGQFTTGDVRLIPQKQQFAGGFFSVRGYEESIVAGDNGIIASAEYRLHLSRLLKPASLLDENRGENPNTLFGQRFNYRAPDLYGAPDWNLILRGFVDYASLEINEIRPDEVEHELMSAGVGIELQLKRNINIRADYGYALETAERFSDTLDPIAEEGDSRFHLMATFSF